MSRNTDFGPQGLKQPQMPRQGHGHARTRTRTHTHTERETAPWQQLSLISAGCWRGGPVQSALTRPLFSGLSSSEQCWPSSARYSTHSPREAEEGVSPLIGLTEAEVPSLEHEVNLTPFVRVLTHRLNHSLSLTVWHNVRDRFDSTIHVSLLNEGFIMTLQPGL